MASNGAAASALTAEPGQRRRVGSDQDQPSGRRRAQPLRVGSRSAGRPPPPPRWWPRRCRPAASGTRSVVSTSTPSDRSKRAERSRTPGDRGPWVVGLLTGRRAEHQGDGPEHQPGHHQRSDDPPETSAADQRAQAARVLTGSVTDTALTEPAPDRLGSGSSAARSAESAAAVTAWSTATICAYACASATLSPYTTRVEHLGTTMQGVRSGRDHPGRPVGRLPGRAGRAVRRGWFAPPARGRRRGSGRGQLSGSHRPRRAAQRGCGSRRPAWSGRARDSPRRRSVGATSALRRARRPARSAAARSPPRPRSPG